MTDKIKYEKNLVAFVDILGFKNMVLQDDECATEIISKIDSAIKHVVSCIKPENYEWCSIKLFSDCFCISTMNEGDNLHNLLSELSFLQYSLCTSDIFVNGAVSYGAHFENERIIFSRGLVQGYLLSQHEPYPRILIDDTVIDLISNNGNSYREACNKHIVAAPDGKLFLDYIQGVREFDCLDEEDVLRAHCESIRKQIMSNSGNSRILEKYIWLSKYHNYKFDKYINCEEYFEDYVQKAKDEFYIKSTELPSFSTLQSPLGLPFAAR